MKLIYATIAKPSSETTQNREKEFSHYSSRKEGIEKHDKDHSALREKLESKGYLIVDEFQCKGFNTNSFMRFLGGMNRGRPNAKDLKNAEKCAQKIKQKLQEI